MTALGIALTVTTAVFLMALLAGLKQAFHERRSPERAGPAQGIDGRTVGRLRREPVSHAEESSRHRAKTSKGEPMVSGERVVVIVLPRKDGTGEINVTVRGMMADGLEMRQLPKDIPR